MTSIAVWPGYDPHGFSSFYIASDSRITWDDEGTHNDSLTKLFASTSSPDIFGFYGYVDFCREILTKITEAGFLQQANLSADRHQSFLAEAQRFLMCRPAQAISDYQHSTGAQFGILHISRDGTGNSSNFTVWHTRWDKNLISVDTVVPLKKDSSLLITLGTGWSAVIDERVDWEKDLGLVSRGVFSAFCDALKKGVDPKSGGAPQLVGLYRKFSGKTFGIIWEGRLFYRGLKTTCLDAGSLEWRNELFERCSCSTMERLPDAQPQPRIYRR